ncbi:hypothetical protein FA15DRAFT_620622, partial [Coprinopsis marcescibilis]
MAPRVSDQLRACIINWHISLQLQPRAISQLAGCSIRTVCYVLSFHRNFEMLHKPHFSYRSKTVSPHRRGRKRALTTADENYIFSPVQARPKIYLDEIQDAL